MVATKSAPKRRQQRAFRTPQQHFLLRKFFPDQQHYPRIAPHQFNVWQFNIAIKPKENNLALSTRILYPLLTQRGLEFDLLTITKKDPATLSFQNCIPCHSWDPLISTKFIPAKDSRGKEAVFFIGYDRENEQYQLNPWALKDLLLSCWKALQRAGVEIAYLSPSMQEKALATEPGILTPFSYSISKAPYCNSSIRHHALLVNQMNPLNVSDPLAGIEISHADLKRYEIRNDADYIREMRISYQTQHSEKAVNSIKNEIRSIQNQSMPLLEDLKNLKDKLQKHKINLSLIEQIADRYPRTPDESHEYHDDLNDYVTSLTQLKLNHRDMAAASRLINAIDTLITQLPNHLHALYDDFKYIQPIHTLGNSNLLFSDEIHQEINKFFKIDYLHRFIAKNPAKCQDIFRKIVHFAYERDALSRETQRQQQFFNQACILDQQKRDRFNEIISHLNGSIDLLGRHNNLYTDLVALRDEIAHSLYASRENDHELSNTQYQHIENIANDTFHLIRILNDTRHSPEQKYSAIKHYEEALEDIPSVWNHFGSLALALAITATISLLGALTGSIIVLIAGVPAGPILGIVAFVCATTVTFIGWQIGKKNATPFETMKSQAEELVTHSKATYPKPIPGSEF